MANVDTSDYFARRALRQARESSDGSLERARALYVQATRRTPAFPETSSSTGERRKRRIPGMLQAGSTTQRPWDKQSTNSTRLERGQEPETYLYHTGHNHWTRRAATSTVAAQESLRGIDFAEVEARVLESLRAQTRSRMLDSTRATSRDSTNIDFTWLESAYSTFSKRERGED